MRESEAIKLFFLPSHLTPFPEQTCRTPYRKNVEESIIPRETRGRERRKKKKGKEEGREEGRKDGMKEGRKGRREGGRKGGRKRGRKEGREEEREEEREGGSEKTLHIRKTLRRYLLVHEKVPYK